MRGYWLTYSLFQKSEFFLVNLNFVEMRSIMNNCTGKWNILWWSANLSVFEKSCDIMLVRFSSILRILECFPLGASVASLGSSVAQNVRGFTIDPSLTNILLSVAILDLSEMQGSILCQKVHLDPRPIFQGVHFNPDFRLKTKPALWWKWKKNAPNGEISTLTVSNQCKKWEFTPFKL